MFRKYMHIERFGNMEVEGIELGEVYVFPKLDGTNSSLWAEWSEVDFDFYLAGGSRNRVLSYENDNAGFLNWTDSHGEYDSFFEKYNKLRLYGEWLVPHTLKTYREDAWKRFWIFDVYNDETEQFLTYETYKPILDEFGLDYVPPLAKIKNGDYENFIHILNQNNFFIKDGEGIGEGIVLKNYDFYNKFGHQIWAKIITSEFKEKHHREMGCPETSGKPIEEKIVDGWLSEALVQKTFDKIRVSHDGWTSKFIPELLNRCYYELVNEELWNAVRDLKDPTVNFKTLKHFTFAKVKTTMKELF
jgi:hypothetical protein